MDVADFIGVLHASISLTNWTTSIKDSRIEPAKLANCMFPLSSGLFGSFFLFLVFVCFFVLFFYNDPFTLLCKNVEPSTIFCISPGKLEI